MRAPLTALAIALTLAACNVGGAADPGNPARSTALGLAEDRTCPLPVPERDTLLAQAILTDDATPVEAFLDARPEDPTGLATRAVIAGQPVVDPDQLACLAPYL